MNNARSAGFQICCVALAACFGAAVAASADTNAARPTLFLIGDSTVKNGSGKGDGGLWG